MTTLSTTLPGGTWTFAPGFTVTRFGYGSMQLAGPGVMGPPADHDEALRVLRDAAEQGITHFDTADAYGPRITNQLIKEALHPYSDSIHIVTKVGAQRDTEGGWPPARAPHQLRDAVQSNLQDLGLETLDLVYLRAGGPMGPEAGSVAESFAALVELQEQGVIRHLGISNALPEQIAEVRAIAPIVSVQNFYNIANRWDDQLIDSLATDGVAYVPFFPLGGFTPVQSDVLSAVAARLDATPMAVALAWLLRRSSNILLIPGTSSAAHLRENISGASLVLSDGDYAELDGIAGQ